MEWTQLTESQKEQYKEYCDKKYGDTYTKCETGEPLYFTEDGDMIDTEIVFDLLFVKTLN